MLRPSQIMEAFPCLSITADWSILSVIQYRHAELYSLIKERTLIHQNNEEPEKCQKKTFFGPQKKNPVFSP
jgi:hypothetical protein